jgi:hypothetical protein
LPFTLNVRPDSNGAASAEAVTIRPSGGGGGGSGGTDVVTAIKKLSDAVDKLTNIADAHEKLLADHEKRITALEQKKPAAPTGAQPMPTTTGSSGN